MKKILLLIMVILLTGCMSAITTVIGGGNPIDAFTMAHFDSNEYQIVTKMRTTAQLVDCGNKESIKSASNRMWFYSNELQNFTQYIPKNEKSYKMAQNLNDIVKGLYDKNGEMGKIYCQEKFKVIEDTTEKIQKATGNKPR
jgi:uncharacterized protein YceK